MIPREELRRRLALYVIPDRSVGAPRSLMDQAQAALAGGATAIQLRDKEATSLELYETARAMVELCRRWDALLIVNDRLDVALASGADGVHLGQEDLPLAEARRIAPDLILGASAHDPTEARQAEAAGADYLGVGALFPTGSKAGVRATGLPGLKSVKEVVTLPLVGIGGITAERIPEVLRQGADGVALIAAAVAAQDPQAAVKELCRTLGL